MLSPDYRGIPDPLAVIQHAKDDAIPAYLEKIGIHVGTPGNTQCH
jgi:hypothetical protein